MTKIIPLCLLLILSFTVPLSANEDAATVKSVENLDKRVSTLESRLGRNVTTPSATNNLERRLDDLEDRVKDLEDLTKALEKLERRVRDLERKK